MPWPREEHPQAIASVLADDPGSSVLTVTSLGLSKRSVRRGFGEKDRNRVVALWKDQTTGWKEIELPEGYDGVVLTVSATRHEELTSDGRSDRDNAAVLELHGVFNVQQPKAAESKHEASNKEDDRDRDVTDLLAKKDPEAQNPQFSKVHDMMELTLWTYFVNSVLDAEDGDLVKDFGRWVADWSHGRKFENEPGRLGMLIPLIGSGLKAYKRDYLENADNDTEVPSKELQCAIQLASKAVGNIGMWGDGKEPMRESENGRTAASSPRLTLHERWSLLVESASFRLKTIHRLLQEDSIEKIVESDPVPTGIIDPIRIHISIPPSILWAVHHRLTYRRRQGNLSPDGASLLQSIEDTLDQYELPETKFYKRIFESLT